MKQIRLPANPKDVGSGYLPIVVGSLRIFTADGKLVAISTHRRETDPEGKKSLWGDIVSPDGKTKYGEVCYSDSPTLCGLVNIDTALFDLYGSSLFFDYSVRPVLARFSPTPHIRMKIEPEEEWAEEILDVKLKSVKNLVEVLRPAHIVVELALIKKIEEGIDEPVEELNIIGIQVLEDYPFDIWRKQGKLFDRKDYGEDSDTQFQYPGTRSGDGLYGIVIDTMINILGRFMFPDGEYGDYVRIKAIEDTYFDILPSDVAKLLGFTFGNNYTEIIGLNAEGENGYNIGGLEDKVFTIRIGTKEYGKLTYYCDFSSMPTKDEQQNPIKITAQMVVEFLRANLQRYMQEGKIWFMPLKDGVYYTLQGEALQVLGMEEVSSINYPVSSGVLSLCEFSEECKLDIYISYGRTQSIQKSIMFSIGVYTIEDVVEMINNVLAEDPDVTDLFITASEVFVDMLRGHHPQHSRRGGNHIIIEVKDKENYTFKLSGSDWGVLGFPVSEELSYYAGKKDEPFDFGTEPILNIRVFYEGEVVANENISLSGILTAQEVVNSILNQLSGKDILNYIDFTAVDDTEPYIYANPYEKLKIRVKSFLDEEYVPILRRDGGLYGSGVVEKIDIDYLYRDMGFPNLRDGTPFLRGRLIINTGN